MFDDSAGNMIKLLAKTTPIFSSSHSSHPTHTSHATHTIHTTHSTSATHTSSATSTPTWIPTLPTVEKAGAAGGRTLWVIFAGMLISSLIFGCMAFRQPVQKRLFHVLTTFITVFATLSYFAMAIGYNQDGHGSCFSKTYVQNDDAPGGVRDVILRQVFWARYIDWSITTPLLLLELAFLAGLSGANVIVTLVASIVLTFTGLFAAFGTSGAERWGWYTMSCLAFLVVVYQLIIPGRKAVMAKDRKTSKFFASIAGFFIILWVLYIVVWGVGDVGRKTCVDSGIITIAILDVLAKPVFGFWVLYAYANTDANAIDGFWSNGLAGEGSIRIDDEGA